MSWSSRTYGTAIESNGISGYNASGDTIFLSLLRAPKSPDATADMGTHHFTYSIVPHAGDWRAPAVLNAARSLNEPLRAVVIEPHAGNGRATAAAVTISGGTVDLGALKRAEDSGAWVIRLVETSGKPANATLRFGRAIGSVSEADLLERPTGTKFTAAGQTLSIPMKAWEIKTIVVSPP
jgi:alpha-mannosidase